MTEKSSFGPFLHLSEKDNVLVARANSREGLNVMLESGEVTLSRPIPMAHKIARRDIAAGDVILKYGMPVGIATAAVAAGEHVHVHNIRSAYTATHALKDAVGRSAGGIMSEIQAFRRSDGRRGIRNTLVVAYLVECAHFVAAEIVHQFRNRMHEGAVQLIGFPDFYPNEHAAQMMEKLCTHLSVGAVLFVSLGCESFDKVRAANAVDSSGDPSRRW